MYEPLAPCPGCRRHVRATSAACPFCGARLAALATIPSAKSRLARGALFAFASTVAACGGTTEPDPTATDTGTLADTKSDARGDDAKDDARGSDTGGVAPPYGVPVGDSGTVDDAGDPMADYGAPPPPADASTGG
jgi:hypothetical protein